MLFKFWIEVKNTTPD